MDRRDAAMIGRIWHGYTTLDNADLYEGLLREEIFTGIRDRHIPGFQEIQLFRRPLGEEVEFITIMWFDSLESVKEFAGSDYEAAVVPPRARQVLKRFDERSQHYELRERLDAAA
jgi:heme-degrading monooxygenase HmoA